MCDGERETERKRVAVVVCGVRRSSRRRRRLPEMMQAAEEGGPAVVEWVVCGGGCNILERESRENFESCIGNERRERESDYIYIFSKIAQKSPIGCMEGSQWGSNLMHKLQGKSLEPL